MGTPSTERPTNHEKESSSKGGEEHTGMTADRERAIKTTTGAMTKQQSIRTQQQKKLRSSCTKQQRMRHKQTRNPTQQNTAQKLPTNRWRTSSKRDVSPTLDGGGAITTCTVRVRTKRSMAIATVNPTGNKGWGITASRTVHDGQQQNRCNGNGTRIDGHFLTYDDCYRRTPTDHHNESQHVRKGVSKLRYGSIERVEYRVRVTK